MKDTVRINITLTKDILELLDKECARLNEDRSTVIRMIVRQILGDVKLYK